MTNWKQRGFVPDSDEEEDDFDTSALLIPSKAERGALVEGFDEQEQQPVPRSVLSRTTAEELQNAIEDGLQTVRSVLGSLPDNNQQEDQDDSPLSSLPSSMANSPQFEPQTKQLISQDSHANVEFEVETRTSYSMADLARQRNLRTRNPIQLHPYMLEDAKYRTLMQARGIKPVQLSKHRGQTETLQGNDDSQNTESFLSSQGLDTQSLNSPSSPTGALEAAEESQSPILGARRYQPESIQIDDDELPELSQILHQQYDKRQQSRKHNREISRPATNVPQHRSQQDSNGQHLPASFVDFDHSMSAYDDGFQIPPSPPSSRESSVFQVSRTSVQKSSLLNVQTPPGLPTPLVSSDTRVFKRPRATLPGIPSDSSDANESDESSSERVTGGGHGLQGITKRIRGVLPASWLRLDMKKQATAAEVRRTNHSDSRVDDEKGVARIVSSSTRKKGFQPKSDVSLLNLGDDSSSDDPDDQQVQNPSPSLDHQSSTEAYPYLHAEAEEDDQIDQMLPPQPRHKTKSGRNGVPKQKYLKDVWGGALKEPEHRPRERTRQYSVKSSTRHKNAKKARVSSALPVMTVLDAPALQDAPRSAQPRFLKVAARQARQYSQPIGLPATKKFFQLATTKDTEEITEAVTAWTLAKGDRLHITGSIAPSTGRVTLPTPGATSGLSPATFQPGPVETSHQISTDLQSLKKSTSALLNRIARAAISDDQPFHPGSPSSAPENNSLASRRNLQSLFPHRNRSGNGRLFSRVGDIRPAQLETTAKSIPLPPATISQKIPRRISTSNKTQVPFKGDQETANTNISAWISGNPPRFQHQRIPRKRIPKKTARAASPPEQASEPTTPQDNTMDPLFVMRAQGHAYSYDSSAFPSRQAEKLMKMAVKQMRLVFPLTPSTRFLNNMIATGILTKTVLRSENAHVYEMETRNSTSEIILMTTPIRRERVGPYDLQTREAIAECHTTITQALNTWSAQSTVILTAIFSLIEYTELSLCFPTQPVEETDLTVGNSSEQSEELMGDAFEQNAQNIDNDLDPGISGRSEFIQASLKFICNALGQLDTIESRAPDSEHKALVRALNYLMIHAWQIHIVARCVTNLQQQAHQISILTIQRALIRALRWNSLDEYLFRDLERFHRPTNRTANFIFGHESVEAETVLTVWHISRRFSDSRKAECFYRILANSMNQRAQTDPVSGISMTLVALSYVVRFTALDPNGHWIPDIEQQPIDLDGWDVLLPLIPRLISYFRGLDQFHAAVVYRHFMKDVVAFIFRLVEQSGWEASPALVKSLLEVYSFNDLVPFEFKGDAIGIFYNHDVVDSVPEHEKNDYDKFVDLVRRAMELQQLLHQDEVGSKAAVSTKELRGLVYSLIPNNAQLYDAREDLQAEHFLALKNHFALYITLYRSSPKGCGPRIQQLEQQVDLEYSHLMVCKLALKVWQVIARHEIKRPTLDHKALRDVGNWYNTILLQIDRRDQTGQSDARSLYADFLNILSDVINACDAEEKAYQIISPTIDRIQTFLNAPNPFGQLVMRAALRALSSYANLAQKRNVNDKLINILLPLVKTSLQSILHDASSNNDLIKTATSTWFAIALATIKSSRKSWFDYIEPRSSLSIDQIGSNDADVARDIAKQFFFSDLIDTEKDAIFLEYRPLIFAAWIVSLLSYVKEGGPVEALTNQILQHGGESLQIATLEGDSKISLGNIDETRFRIVQHVVQNIYGQQDSPESEWLAGGLDEGDMLELLRTMTGTMKRVWKELQDDPVAQNNYTKLVQAIVNEMEIYPARGFKLDPWFTDGKEFPRPSQTFDNMFKCPFGHEGSEITKSSVVTLRMKCIEALKFEKQKELIGDLNRVFCCDDSSRIRFEGSQDNSDANPPQFSIDLKKQTQFIMIIMPAYIGQATAVEKNALAVLPILKFLHHITRNIFFRIDNMDPNRMVSFIHASNACLTATRKTLELTEPTITVATPALLEYAHQAVVTIMQLFEVVDVDALESTREAFAFNVFGIVKQACGLLPRSDSGEPFNYMEMAHGLPADLADYEWGDVTSTIVDVAEMEAMALKFFDCFPPEANNADVPISPREIELRKFAIRDLEEGLAAVGAVKEVGFERDRVEAAARAYLKLIKSIPLLPEEMEDEDEW